MRPAGHSLGGLSHHDATALCVINRDPWHWLSASGRVTDIRPDGDLAYIDRMSRRYTGADDPRRTPREVFHITIDRLSHSPGRRG